MRLEATVYCTILLSLCFCVSNGTPPKEVSGGRSSTPPNSKKYTDKEDESIVEELSSLLDVPYSRNIWNTITEKHNEKWRRKTPGFSQERSCSGLRNRFWGILIHNYPYVNVKVPESLLKKLGKENLNKMEEGTSSSQSTGPNLHIDSQASAGTALAGSRLQYTEEEDMLIVEELSRLDVLHSRNVWNKIKKKQNEKCKEKAPGFPKERSALSLYHRFWGILSHNYPHIKVQVPETLMEVLKETNRNVMKKDVSSSYSTAPDPQINSQVVNEEEDEEDAWVQELLNDPFYNDAVDEFPDTMDDADMVEESPNNTDVCECRGTDTSSLQFLDVYPLIGYANYTEEEDNFIVNEISSLPGDCIHVHSRHLWKKIAAKHRKKWEDGTPGFVKERSADSLHKRFRIYLMTNKPNKVKVPENTKRKFMTSECGQITTGSRYTEEEDKFIVEELSKPSYTSMFSSSTLKSVHAEHIKKHEAKIPGFENARSVRSLVVHISIMKNCGLLPNKSMKKPSAHQRENTQEDV